MKLCPKCGETKATQEFHRNKGRKDGLQSSCKVCKKRMQACWYRRNSALHKGNAKKNKKVYRAVSEKFIHEFLGSHPCVDCGETDPLVLEFDHRDEKTKRNNVCTMVIGGLSLPTIKVEIAKCDVRCANCHRRRSAERGKYWMWRRINGP